MPHFLTQFFDTNVPVELFEDPGKTSMYNYPAMTKTMTGSEAPGQPVQTFKLHVEKGQFTDSEIVVMLGECGSLVLDVCRCELTVVMWALCR